MNWRRNIRMRIIHFPRFNCLVYDGKRDWKGTLCLAQFCLIMEKRAHSFVQRTMKTKKHRGKASDDGGEKHLVLMRNSAFNNNCLCAAFGWCLTLSGWRPQFLLTSAKKHCDISTLSTQLLWICEWITFCIDNNNTKKAMLIDQIKCHRKWNRGQCTKVNE